MHGFTRSMATFKRLHASAEEVANKVPESGCGVDAPERRPASHTEPEIPDSHWTRAYIEDYSPEHWMADEEEASAPYSH